MTPTVDQLHRLEPAAYRWLVRTYRDRLLRYFVGSTGDRELGDELVARTFASLVDAFHRRRSRPENLTAFVFGVARNHLRHHRRDRRPVAPVAALDTVPDPAPDATRTVVGDQELQRVLGWIGAFDETVREVFVLRFVEDMSIADIAALTGQPPGTIKSHIHRGRRALRAQLDRDTKESS